LVFFGIMLAAKVGCPGSCTRFKSQADKGETTPSRISSMRWYPTVFFGRLGR